jgi:predicted ATPase
VKTAVSPRIVLTGGPSAGKTTLLNLLEHQYGQQIAIAPEAASILFNGGFPRPQTFEDVIHTQRSIYSLQEELELQALDRFTYKTTLFCDRGSLDGFAYWPSSLNEFCLAMGTTLEKEMNRYTAVIHLQTAQQGHGYTNTSVRLESHEQARELDEKIGKIWSVHPQYFFIPNAGSFVEKLTLALDILSPHLPKQQSPQAPSRYLTTGDMLAQMAHAIG